MKHCLLSHQGSNTYAINKCPPLLTDQCQTVDFEGVRGCRSRINGIHNSLSESNHPSLLLWSAERQLSLQRDAKQLSKVLTLNHPVKDALFLRRTWGNESRRFPGFHSHPHYHLSCRLYMVHVFSCMSCRAGWNVLRFQRSSCGFT